MAGMCTMKMKVEAFSLRTQWHAGVGRWAGDGEGKEFRAQLSGSGAIKQRPDVI